MHNHKPILLLIVTLALSVIGCDNSGAGSNVDIESNDDTGSKVDTSSKVDTDYNNPAFQIAGSDILEKIEGKTVDEKRVLERWNSIKSGETTNFYSYQRIALAFYYGAGVEKDLNLAMTWFQEAEHSWLEKNNLKTHPADWADEGYRSTAATIYYLLDKPESADQEIKEWYIKYIDKRLIEKCKVFETDAEKVECVMKWWPSLANRSYAVKHGLNSPVKTDSGELYSYKKFVSSSYKDEMLLDYLISNNITKPDADMVKQFIQNKNGAAYKHIQMLDAHPVVLLITAAKYNDYDVVAYLLNKGVSIDDAEDKKINGLVYQLFRFSYVESAELLSKSKNSAKFNAKLEEKKAASLAELSTLMNKATEGDAMSQYELALKYYKGSIALPKDLNSAKNWLNKSSEQGHAKAMLKLALISGLKGKALVNSVKKSAEAGSFEAAEWVGRYYEDTGDYGSANMWYRRAVSLGSAYADRDVIRVMKKEYKGRIINREDCQHWINKIDMVAANVQAYEILMISAGKYGCIK